MTTRTEFQRLTTLLERDGAHFLEAFDRQVHEHGDRPALIHGDSGKRLSFGDLGRKTDYLAANLCALGIKHGDVISVLTTDPLVSALAMIGIWKAAAIYAPVNFQYAGQLLTYTLNDAKPAVLIVDEDLLPRVEAVANDLTDLGQIVVVERSESAGPAPRNNFRSLLDKATRPRIDIDYGTLCSLIYTSGTTGPSKGVLHSHRWINQYTWLLRGRLSSDDVVYNDLPMYHVGGAYAAVIAGLWVGAEVWLWDRFSPHQFWPRIAQGSCTATILLDVMIPWLMGEPPSATDRHNTLNKAHMQPLPVGHNAFARRFGIDSVSAGFGQTESGAPASIFIEECADGSGTPMELYRGTSVESLRALAAEAAIPVLGGTEVTRKAAMGSALPFFDVAVLNDRDEPCEPNIAGQWAIRPKLPSLLYGGYLDKPDKTVEANRNFWFHTGDSAVLGDDGLYYFLDRLGDRIRVRGENVSSVHVEEIIGGHPDVQMCAVVAIPSARSDEDDIVAFIETVDGRALDEQELRFYAEAQLPKFMRPWAYRFTKEIPRTPTNKIEKHKLRAQALEVDQ